MFKHVDTAVVVSWSNYMHGVLIKISASQSCCMCSMDRSAYTLLQTGTTHTTADRHSWVPCSRAPIGILSCAFDFISLLVDAEVRARVLRVDALAGKLSLTLRPLAVDGADAKSTANEDAVDGGASDEEADLDEEMAARLDDEVLCI